MINDYFNSLYSNDLKYTKNVIEIRQRSMTVSKIINYIFLVKLIIEINTYWTKIQHNTDIIQIKFRKIVNNS